MAVERWRSSEKYNLTGVHGAAVFRDLPEGTRLRMVTGEIVEILANARNGSNLIVKVLEDEKKPSSVGEEQYVLFTDVQEAVEEGVS
jgi:hypothetical protein